MASIHLKQFRQGRTHHCETSTLFNTSVNFKELRAAAGGFLEVNVVPFLSDAGFQLFKSADLFKLLCFVMGKMFSIGEKSGLLAGHFSTRTTLLQRQAVVMK